MRKNFYFVFFLFFITLTSYGSDIRSNLVGEIYRSRYPIQSAKEKLVDNSGKGLMNLYGTRNVRAVLNGVYYRGGANNIYLDTPRKNMNPLPDIGIKNLCEEGFSHAVYLYSTNYKTAPKELKCKTFEGNDNTISYLQISPLKFQTQDIRKLHRMIFDHVQNPRLGPVYDHCWNGWHASGFVAATALRQFCGFSVEQAISYWNINTDGANGSEYNLIREQIKKFEIDPDMNLSEEEKSLLCPDPSTLLFK